MKTARNPDTVHPPIGLYSHQVEVTGSPRWLAIAGQVARTREGTVPADPVEQISLVLENLRRNLEAAGMKVKDIVKWNWYLVGDIDPAARREVTAAFLAGHEPASTLVYVARLAAPEYRVEVEAWACRA